jgi:hypothetical protein
VGAWVSALGTLAFAQILPGQWVGDLYMVRLGTMDDQLSWAFIDERDNVRSVVPGVRQSSDALGLCQGCGGASLSHWHGGALHTLAGGGEVEEGGKAYRRHAFAKWQDGEWSLLGVFKTSGPELLQALPCDNGRFIAISCFADLFGNGRPDRSPFSRIALREGEDELGMDASIDHGQDDLRKYIREEPRIDPSRDNGREMLRYMLEPSCFRLAYESADAIVMTDGRATLVNRATGLYWVFSTEKATLIKAGCIFKKVTPEMAAKGGFRRAVLCAQPEKSGTVLLSAQDEGMFTAETEDAHREADALYEKHEKAPRGVPHQTVDWIEGIRERRLEEVKARSPLIVWYRIHPEDGRVERLPAPPEGGASIREIQDRDCWRPMPDGSVRMGWDPRYVDIIKAQASELAGGRGGGVVAKKKEAEGAESAPGGEGPAKGDAPPEENAADGGTDKDKDKDKDTDKDNAPAA